MDQSKLDNSLIMQIVQRAKRVAMNNGSSLDTVSLIMDLDCVHARTPLRLIELRDADDFNFIHDVFGIQRHLNRNTGELGDFFTPRYVNTVAHDLAARNRRPD